jgi:hypothetical protein
LKELTTTEPAANATGFFIFCLPKKARKVKLGKDYSKSYFRASSFPSGISLTPDGRVHTHPEMSLACTGFSTIAELLSR